MMRREWWAGWIFGTLGLTLGVLFWSWLLGTACNTGKALSDNKATIVDKAPKAGRDVMTIDSKTSIILAGGMVACLGLSLRQRRRATHAEKGICRIAGVIEHARKMDSDDPRTLAADSLARAVKFLAKSPNDPVERVINKCVKRATGGAKGGK